MIQPALREPISVADADVAYEVLRKLAQRYPPNHTMAVLTMELQRVLTAEVQVEHGQAAYTAFTEHHHG